MTAQLKRDQQLFNAVEENNLNGVQNLVAQGANVNFSGDYARTPLNEAARQGNLAIVAFLLKNGADPTMACENGYPVDMVGGDRAVAKKIEALLYARMYVFSLIFLAVEAGDIAMAENALLQGGSVNVFTPMGATPLSLAVISENLEMAQWLLSHGADVNAKLPEGEAAFTLAKTESMTKLLLQHHANIKSLGMSGNKALYKACMAGNLALARFLINNGIMFDKTPKPMRNSRIEFSDMQLGMEMVRDAGVVEIARILLAAGADLPKDPGWLSLLLGQKLVIDGEAIDDAELLFIFSRDWMNNELCELFISKGADVTATDVNGDTALHVSNCVEVLLKAGANIEAKNLYGESPLLTACLAGAYQASEALIKNGADITVLQKLIADKTHALFNAAVRYGCPYLLDKLLKLGLDVNSRHDGSYALIRAATHNELEVAKCLIAHGADANLSNYDGCTALTQSGSLAMAQLMIDHGARVDAIDSEGMTLLHKWCNAQPPKLEMVEFLIKQGCDVNAKNHGGKTPLQYSGSSALVSNYLLEHGANTDGVLDASEGDEDGDLIMLVLMYQAWKKQQVEIALS